MKEKKFKRMAWTVLDRVNTKWVAYRSNFSHKHLAIHDYNKSHPDCNYKEDYEREFVKCVRIYIEATP